MFFPLNTLLLPKSNRACLSALKRADGWFAAEKAYPHLRARVSGAILAHRHQGAHLLDYMDNPDFSSMEITLYLVEAMVQQGLAARENSQNGERASLARIHAIAAQHLRELAVSSGG
jgi:hypothetical protein